MAIQIKDQVKTCIEECAECSNQCLTTIKYCLERGGNFIQPAFIQSLMDCAEFCQATVSFLLQETSEDANSICSACADMATKCAEMCEEDFPDIPQMQTCAEACRGAADACRQVVSGF